MLCRQGILDEAAGALAAAEAAAALSSSSSLTFLQVGGEAWKSSAFSLQHMHTQHALKVAGIVRNLHVDACTHRL